MNKTQLIKKIENSLNRKLVILDLDNTCICAIETENIKDVVYPDSFKSKDLEDIYRIYERPGLQSFLDDLFKYYDVAVWTAAGLTYALFVIDNFILSKKGRNLKFILWDEHCVYSSKRHPNKLTKDLSLLYPFYNKENMVLIDDNDNVVQQEGVIHSDYFDITNKKSKHDKFLYKTMNLIHEYFTK